jgi:hypothetical protein
MGRHPFERTKHRRTVMVRDTRIDGCTANVAVPEVVLDELKRQSRIKEMRRDRVPECMTGVAIRKASGISVAGEQRLDLSLLERTITAGEERVTGVMAFSDKRLQ